MRRQRESRAVGCRSVARSCHDVAVGDSRCRSSGESSIFNAELEVEREVRVRGKEAEGGGETWGRARGPRRVQAGERGFARWPSLLCSPSLFYTPSRRTCSTTEILDYPRQITRASGGPCSHSFHLLA